jgi:hypothetical protein
MKQANKMPLRLQKYLNQNKKPNNLGTIKSSKKDKTSKVLFLNHKKKECGVYQYGKRLHDILRKCDRLCYEYKEIENENEYRNLVNNVLYKAVIYNYQVITMPWLNNKTIDNDQHNIGILHECDTIFFTKKISTDPNTPETIHYYNIPRPILEDFSGMDPSCLSNEFKDFCLYSDGITPVFGSFGFGFENKGFPNIVKMVNEQYDNAIIKFVIPCAHFGGDPTEIQKICDECFRYNTKPGIIIKIHTRFVSENELLLFLRSNTMNIFLYDNLHGRGISSTIDYALSVRRPLGISDSFMFRHIYSDEICLYKNPIQTCMENSLTYCEKFLSLYSHKNMIDKFHYIIHSP